MKTITKIRKAKDKVAAWNDAVEYMTEQEKRNLLMEMVLSLPKGYYRLRSREYSQNIIDVVWDIYGWIPAILINESILLGAQCLYPKRIYASFTLGLDAIEIK